MNKTNSLFDRYYGPIVLMGLLLFVLLYIYSSSLYPGGSQVDENRVGFDWLNNYWCNLMNEKALNGEVNPARIFAISAMFVLCASLILFFIQFSAFFETNNTWKIIIKLSGVLSMISAMFIFTKYHDLMTIVSSFFGLFAVFGIIRSIYFSELKWYKWVGLFCILLLGLNNFIYYTNYFIVFLPLLQKITFVFVLGWIAGLSLKMKSKIIV